MKLINCKTVLTALVEFEDDSGTKFKDVVCVDLVNKEVFTVSGNAADDARLEPLKDEVLNKYCRKPVDRPEMPENAWNKTG